MNHVRLQRLQLRNFKSFRKASIPFSDGFTAIAGANGSGKSNILDALLFVSGITSLKMLRAGKLTDLVNHDAEDNEARVDLIIEHGQSSGEKKVLELSRSIDRTGKSVYRIDQKRSTLNEVASLLQELSIDPNGHNIVVQGDITHIIQMNPKERREMLDDAAGIREFDEKRTESMKELDKVEVRIKEVRIVLHEREVFLQKMEEERLIASKYNELAKELKESKGTLLQLELTDQQGRLGELEKNEQIILKQLQDHLSQKQLLNGEINQLQAQWDEANNQLLLASGATFEGVGKLLQEKESDQKIAAHDLNALNEREKELNKSQQLFLTDFERTQTQLPQISQEIQHMRSQLEEAESAWKKAEKEKATDHWREALEKKNHLEGELTSLKRTTPMAEQTSQHARVMKELEEVESQFKTVKDVFEKLVAQKSHEAWQTALQEKNNWMGQIHGIEKSIQKVKGLEKACPTCEQELPKKYIEKIVKEREAEKEAIAGKIALLEKKIEEHHHAWNEELKQQKETHEMEKKMHQKKAEVEREAAKEKQIALAKESLVRMKHIESELPQLETQVKEWNHKREAEMQLLEKKRQLEQELHRKSSQFEQESDRLNRSKVQSQKESKELEAIFAKKEALLKRQGELIEQVKQLRAQLEQEMEKNKDLAERKEVLKAKLHQQQEKRMKSEEEIRNREKNLNEIGIEKSKCMVRSQDLSEELKNYAEVPRLENATIAQLRERLPKIERDIQSMGAINMKALENFEHYYKEIEEISNKVKKLEEERIAVLDLINSIGIRRHEAFMKCFLAVNQQFSEIYFTFFEGEGKLELTDELNLSESGLLIQARHKGEKLKSIDLMSGGEKTLTALAFLFAIQMYSPSPFYVFDEADAALDKENSSKLAKMIRSISTHGQFIAITHNDALIKNAQQVVGVALNKQKSSVIGLKLEDVLPQHSGSQMA